MIRAYLFLLILTYHTLASADEPYGLEKRVPWTTSRVRGTPDPPLPYRTERVFPNLAFKNPVTITSAPGTDRMFVVEQSGKIFSISPSAKEPQAELMLDVNELIERLKKSTGDKIRLDNVYGLTFHPNFAKNRELFVSYCIVNERRQQNGQDPEGSRVVRLKLSQTEPPLVDLASEELILTWLQGGHNGASIKFGPDGFLYISTGDAGMAFPPDGRKTGQNLTDFESCILRIDVDHPAKDKPYSIPRDNPFVETPNARGEIWAYGLRNPWKISFDRASGDLWVGDVGWELWELVYRVRKGANYGWSVTEGRQPVHAEGARGPTPIVAPTIEIPHVDGASVTGGFVYRGKKFPELVGSYVFGDWETRRIWAAKIDGEKIELYKDICPPAVRIIDFAEDNAGELYLLDYDDGTIHTLVRHDATKPPEPFPTKLSETGLYRSVVEQKVSPGVLPFSVNAEQWSDFAKTERYIAVPNEERIQLHAKPQQVPGSMFSRSLDFPENTVLIKTLSLEMQQGEPKSRRRVETQMLHYDGRDWRGYSYAWNDEQNDAALVPASGATRTITVADAKAPGGKQVQDWKFEARANCLRCHNPWAEYTLGFNVPQINRKHDYGSAKDNQIRTLRHIGLLEDVVPQVEPTEHDQRKQLIPIEADLPKLVSLDDPKAPLDKRARAYLHANCAHCHRAGGGGSAYVHLPFDLPLSETRTLGVRPAQGTFGIAGAEVIKAGDPYRSTLYLRLAKLGPGHMPHLGTTQIDREGLALIHDWIRNLPPRSEDAQLLERLTKLGEEANLTREAREAARVKWEMAREFARQQNHPRPTAKDIEQAAERATREAEERVKKRASDRVALATDILATPSRALLTVRAIDEDQFAPAIRELVLDAAAKHADAATRDLFESYLPAEKRSRRLGDAVDPAAIFKLAGDGQRGRELFHRSTTLQCRNCHKAGGEGVELGPDLSLIGKKLDRSKLLTSILEPSKEIDPKFQTWLVETTDGRAIVGLLVKRDTTELILKDAANKEIKLAASDVEQAVPQPKSLMPDLMLRDLTPQQAADLLSYLESLK